MKQLGLYFTLQSLGKEFGTIHYQADSLGTTELLL